MRHPHTNVLISTCLVFILLSGCTLNKNETMQNNHKVEFNHISSSNHKAEQEHSNKVKKILSTQNELHDIKAVNSDKQIIVGIDVKQLERFNLKAIRKKTKKYIEKNLPHMEEVIVSTDKKIIMELEKLENNIKADEKSRKDINKEVKKLIKLSKAEN